MPLGDYLAGLAFFAGVDRTVGGYEGLSAAQQCLPNNEMRDKFAAGHKPSFVTYATALNQHAGELVAAAEAKDAARAGQALSAARAACRGCHKENR